MGGRSFSIESSKHSFLVAAKSMDWLWLKNRLAKDRLAEDADLHRPMNGVGSHVRRAGGRFRVSITRGLLASTARIG